MAFVLLLSRSTFSHLDMPPRMMGGGRSRRKGWAASFLALFVSLLGCSKHRPVEYGLEESWAVSLDGSFHGIRDATDFATVGEEIYVLDRVSNRLHSVSTSGDFIGSQRLGRTRDGYLPRLIVPLRGGLLLLASPLGNSCEILDSRFERIQGECSFPEEISEVHGLVPYIDGVIVLGRHQITDLAVHVLRKGESGFEVLGSFRPIRPERRLRSDSLHLPPRVGPAVVLERLLLTTESVEFVEVWSLEGDRLADWKIHDHRFPPVEMVAKESDLQSPLGPLLRPEVTGIAEWGGLVFSSTYYPLGDSTVVRLFREGGNDIRNFTVPFRFQVETAANGRLVATRRIRGNEMAIYEIRRRVVE